MSSFRTRALATVGAAAIAVTTLTGMTSPASAVGKVVLTVAYKASGKTYLKSTGSTVALAPTKLTTGLDKNGYFKGAMPLKPAAVTGKIAGLLPVTATATFIAAGPVTGRLTTKPTTRVSATAKYTIQLSNVTVGGVPALVGDSCKTVAPVSIPVATPKGKTFDVTKGGTVSGSYTIGKFANCGLSTLLLNGFIPSAGNTVSFKLSGGKVVY